jgi:hypothetical protein
MTVLPDPEESPVVPLWPTAGEAVHLGRSATFAAHKRGQLPFPVLQCGGRLMVPTAALRRVLELDVVR